MLGYSHHWECRCGTGEEEEVVSAVSNVVGHDSWGVPSYLVCGDIRVCNAADEEQGRPSQEESGQRRAGLRAASFDRRLSSPLHTSVA